MLHRTSRLVAWAMCLLVAGRVWASDYLSGQGRFAWSPNGRWIVFNWPMKDDLLVVDTQSPVTFLLKPAGDIKMDEAWVLSAESPTATKELSKQRVPRVIPSPGTSKLTFLEWSPDSQAFAYRYGKRQRAVFSVTDGRVVKSFDAEELLPWQAGATVVSVFDYVKPTADTPARYRLRIRQLDGTELREFAFTNTEELSQIGSMRFRDISFLSNNRQFVLLPRFTPAGWLLMREPVLTREAPQPVTTPSAVPPYEWKLTPDDAYLALTDRQALRMGPLEKFERAGRVPVQNVSIATAWSPDGRSLAYHSQQSLHVWHRDEAAPRVVSDFCATRFWGWRGMQLLFGHAQTGFANLYRVRAVEGAAEVACRAPVWQTAPREIGLTTDGSKLGVLVTHIDGSGRTFWQVWQVRLDAEAKWEQIFEFRP